MSKELDDLANLLDDLVLTHTGRSIGLIASGRVADQVFDAGYRQPARTVSTVEEIGELEDRGAVLLDKEGISWQQQVDGGWGIVGLDASVARAHLIPHAPFTVIHEGGA